MVVTSKAFAVASAKVTSLRLIAEAFASTTSNVTVASVPSASGAAPVREVAAIVTLLSVAVTGVANAPAGR